MGHNNQGHHRTVYEWAAALPAFLVLVFVILLNTSHTMHAQILQLGERFWEGYFELRHDPVEPVCNPNTDIESELQRRIDEQNGQVIDEFDLFAPDPINPEAMRISLQSAKDECELKFSQYSDKLERITPGLETFRVLEQGISKFGEIGLSTERILLAILVLICGGTALMRRHHISLRPMITVMDYRVAAGAQAIAFSMLFYLSLIHISEPTRPY